MKIRTTLRPPQGGGLPRDVRWVWVERPRTFEYRPSTVRDGGNTPVSVHPYGVVETDRDLTPGELIHFDLEVVP